jgi:hypothetical protein
MVLGSLPGLGQHTAGLRSAQLRTGILSLLDPYNPGLELSAERKLDAKTSVQLSLAYLHDFLGTTPYKDFSGARAAVAKKWAFPARRRHRLYRALEFGVSVAGYGTEGRFAIPNADGSVNLFYRHYYESFTVQKQTAFAGGRVGIQGAFGQFVYDASVGGGVKYKRTQHVGRRYPGGILFPGFIKLDPYQFADKEMKGLTGNLPVSVSIGYTF